jgi:hypothetical protein
LDLAQFAGLDYADVTIAGQRYRVGELTLREWAPVQAWMKATVPGPLAVLASPDFKRLSADLKREVLGEAMDRDRFSWPPAIGRRSWYQALDHPAETREGMPFDPDWDKPSGHAVALLAVLARHQPGITLGECQALAERATFAEIVPAFAAALGLFGPKSQPPAPPEPGAKATTKGAGGQARKASTNSARRRSTSSKPADGPATTSSA